MKQKSKGKPQHPLIFKNQKLRLKKKSQIKKLKEIYKKTILIMNRIKMKSQNRDKLVFKIKKFLQRY